MFFFLRHIYVKEKSIYLSRRIVYGTGWKLTTIKFPAATQ